MSRHKSLAGVNLHKAFNWVQTADPAVSNPSDLVDGHYWHKTSDGSTWYRVSGAWVAFGGLVTIAPTDVTGLSEYIQDTVGALIGDSDTVEAIYFDGANNLALDVVDDSTTQKVMVSLNSSNVGSRKKLNFIEGAGIDLTVTDDSGDNEVEITVASTITQYTDEKAQDAIGAAIAAGTQTGITVAYNDAGNKIDFTVSGISTTLDGLTDVDTSGVADGDTLIYDSGTSAWLPGTPAAGYSDEQARDAIGAALVGGTGITVTPFDGADTITIATTITQYTAEDARDDVGAALVAGAGITVTLDDPGDHITIANTITQYTDEKAMDAVAAMIAAGSHTGIAFSYNDAADALSATVSGGGAPGAHEATHLSGGTDALSGNLDAIARVGVRKNSTGSVAQRRRLNLIEGTGVTLTVADDSTDEEVDITIAASGSYTNENAMDAIAAMLAAGTHVGITVTYNDASDLMSLKNTGPVNQVWAINEGGVPAVEAKMPVLIPYAATIKGWYIIADASGDLTLDLWKLAFATGVPTNANSIVAAAKPSLSSAQKNSDTTLTGWTTSVAANDIMILEVEFAATVQKFSFNLILERA